MEELHYRGLVEIGEAIRRREVSSLEVTRHLLARIDRLQPSLRAYATVMAERALTDAARADAEIGQGHWRGPLHGVPIAVKDLCFTTDAPTGSGTRIFRDWIAPYDATVVTRLADAGAVLLGKLQLTEGATGSHHPDIAHPVNPWSAGAWTGVSSSGSGVATAAGLCFGSLGSDTAGSIRFPSNCCGVTGLKPTWGRVSRHGVFPLCESLDHIGPMTRSSADAAALMGVLAGDDPMDPTSLTAPVPDYLAGLDAGVEGLRIGIDWTYASAVSDAAVVDALKAALAQLAEAGAQIVDVTMPPLEPALSGGLTLFIVETALSHEATYPEKKDDYGPGLAGLIEFGLATPSLEVARAIKIRREFSGALTRLFNSVDLIAAPAIPVGVPDYGDAEALMSNPDTLLKMVRFTLPFDMSGSPTITLPCGSDARGLPIGFQLIGAPLSEALLLRAGHSYQQITDWHTRHPEVG